MYCKICHQDYPDHENCPNCQPEGTPAIHRSGPPTLIKGPNTPLWTQNRPRERRGSGLLPLIWAAAILIAVPWLLTDRSRPLTVDTPTAAAPEWSAAPADLDSDQIHLVLKAPANSWIDTGIDMCGCAHITIRSTGTWTTPTGDQVGARGLSGVAGFPTARHDALTHSAAYGALLGRVGRDPYVDLGASSHVDGDQFSDTGTLKIGINAGRHSPVDADEGFLTVRIDGQGTTDHAPTACSIP